MQRKYIFLYFILILVCTRAYADFPATRTDIDNALATASSPFPIDLDQDGDIDIVAAGNGANSVVWYANTGANVFTLNTIDTALNSAISTFPIDLDRDGDIDIVAASNIVAGSIVWYENDGTNAFTRRTITAAALNGAISTFPVDLDQDGDIDIVAAGNGANSVVWYEQVGDPTQTANWTLRTINLALNGARATFPVDLDRDGDVDIVAVGNGANTVVWYEQTGDPTVQANWTQRTINNALIGAISVFPVDLDRDGDIDVVAAGTGANSVVWYQVTGDPTVQANWTQQNIDAAFNAPTSVIASDVDGDGDFDVLATGNAGANEEVSWWESDGTPINGGWTQHVIDGNIGNATAISAFDIDRDGDIDVVESAANQIAWFPNDIDRDASQMGFKNRVAIDSGFAGARSGCVEDLDMDGEFDVVAVTPTDGIISWWRNNGAENFTKYNVSSSFAGAWHVFTEDLDIDGDLDIIVSSRSNDTLAWFESDRTPVNGGWTQHNISMGIGGPYETISVDLDQDGDLDLVTVTYDNARLIWWESDGTPINGGWTQHIIHEADSSLSSVNQIDLDQDGDPDLVISSDAAGLVKWFENDGTPGNGGWIEHEIAAGIGTARSVEVADINKDGDIDIAAALKNVNDIVWWESDGTPRDGGWRIHYVDRSFEGVESICLEDIERNGSLDVFGVSNGASDVFWWEQLNPASDSWKEYTLDFNFVGPNSTFAADLDKDGDVDLISCASTSNEVAWWENVPIVEAETPLPDAMATTGIASINPEILDLGGDEEVEIEPPVDEVITLAEEDERKSEVEEKAPEEKKTKPAKKVTLQRKEVEMIKDISFTPIDYDNMFTLNYASGEKIIVIINPAKKKSIVLLFEKNVNKLGAGESLLIKQERGPEFMLKSQGLQKEGKEIELDLSIVRNGKISDEHKYYCSIKSPEQDIAKYLFNRE